MYTGTEDNSAKPEMCSEVENPTGIFLINYPSLCHDNIKILLCTHAMFLVNVHLQMTEGALRGHICSAIQIQEKLCCISFRVLPNTLFVTSDCRSGLDIYRWGCDSGSLQS